MSMQTGYVLHAIYHSGMVITQLEDAAAGNAFNELIGMSAGHHYPLFTGILENKPEFTFRSSQLRTLMNGIPLFALDLSGGNTDLEWRQAVDLGARVAIAAVSHIRTRMTQGLIYMQSLSAQQGQVAQYQGRIAVTWDGTNNPLVPAASVAISATPQAAEQFTLGPVKINGSWVNGVIEQNYESGIQAWEEISDGDVYPTFGGVKEFNPIVCTVKTRESTNWSTYGVSAGTALSGGFLGYLRRVAPDSIPYATNQNQHLKLSGDYGIVLGASGQGGGNELISTELRILFRQNSYSGAAPLVPTIDSQIV